MLLLLLLPPRRGQRPRRRQRDLLRAPNPLSRRLLFPRLSRGASPGSAAGVFFCNFDEKQKKTFFWYLTKEGTATEKYKTQQTLTSPAKCLPLKGVRESKLRAVEEEQCRGKYQQRYQVDGGWRRGRRGRGRKGRAHRHQSVSALSLFRRADANHALRTIISGGRQDTMRDVPLSQCRNSDQNSKGGARDERAGVADAKRQILISLAKQRKQKNKVSLAHRRLPFLSFLFFHFLDPFDCPPPKKNGLLRDRPPPERGIRRRRRIEALLFLLPSAASEAARAPSRGGCHSLRCPRGSFSSSPQARARGACGLSSGSSASLPP